MPVYFSIVSGQVRTQSDASLQNILTHVLHQLASLDLDGAHLGHLAIVATAAAQEEIVRALYDADTLPLVTAQQAVTYLLDPQQKARLLVEGIAGAVAVVAQLTRLAIPVTPALLTRELQRFAVSARQQYIRDAVEHSHLFSSCLMMSQILDLIMDAGLGAQEVLHAGHVASFDDYSADMFCSERERAAARDMGLHGGFVFMVLN